MVVEDFMIERVLNVVAYAWSALEVFLALNQISVRVFVHVSFVYD